MRFHVFYFILALLLSSCKYERQVGCHLDIMNVKGNVIKIETYTPSTIPLTELYYNSYDPSQSIWMLGGNFVFEFDNHGNLKSNTGYGIDGKVLFVTKEFITAEFLDLSTAFFGVKTEQSVDRIETDTSSDGRIINAKYYSNNELIWNLDVKYNNDGEVISIIKENCISSIKLDYLSFLFADTTTYEYSSFDEKDNWTEVNVKYRGIIPLHNCDYKMIRQITYDGENEAEPLVTKIKAPYHKENITDTITNYNLTRIGNYGTIKMPKYMTFLSDNYIGRINNAQPGTPIDYLFMSKHDNSEVYATFSISKEPNGPCFDNLPPDMLTYNTELDQALRAQFTNIMTLSETYILKWLPYCFTTLSGKRTLKIRYYRYGNGIPQPVYCEQYIVPMNDRSTLSIIFSFQSNLHERFFSDFSNAINSIHFD